uniref:Capsid protein n=1 Tax=Phoenicopteridae parvo-like hybrid virus TaxID=2794528 RepID=A0A8A4XE43_9VIRU|nr:MAG: capsid protein [Phoenicopteridae parvo-like hybrid virus]
MARGWVPPGYSYLGPGNDLHRGPPRNANDVLAQDHDRRYTAIMEAGGQPYTRWSEADREFYENLTVNDIPTAVAKGLFGIKKGIHAAGLRSSVEDLPRSRNMARSGRLRGSTSFNDESQRRAIEHGKAAAAEARRARDERVNAGRLGLGDMVQGANNDAETSLANLPRVPDDDDLGENNGTLLDDMEVPGNDGENVEIGNAMVSFAAGGGGPNAQSKETPVSIPPSITYGLQETHTTILPWTGWLAAVNIDYGTPVQLPIRMNAISDMIPVTTIASPASGAAFGAKGISGRKVDTAGNASTLQFPATFTGGSTDPTERPAWRNYWFDIYDYYTVLKCHYEIIFENPLAATSVGNLGLLVGTQFDSYSDTASSVGNVMPLATLADSLYFKNMRWEKTDSQYINEQQRTDGNRSVISGTWMPGMTKRNIVNDGDVKTWTKTDGTIPNLKEIFTVNFWRHPFAIATGGTTSQGFANIQINLKYVVQFKDLKLQARYPNTTSAAGFDIQQNLTNTPITGDAQALPIV